MIHPTAVVHPKAQLDSSIDIGPYAVIDGEVVMGPGCRVGPHVYITGRTRIGANNLFHAGCVVGDAPQDLKYKGEPTELWIGDNNVIREGATIHRSAKLGEATVVGSNNFIMVNSHIGHNAGLGDNVILANGALLAGHVHVGNSVFISGNCLVHQFVRIGTLALMQGGSAISRDLPPYTVASRSNGICGLNVIGLRRAGVTAQERLELKKLYHKLFRTEEKLENALVKMRAEFTSAPARVLLEFVASSRRGVCRDVSRLKDGGKIDGENEADID